MVPETTPVVVNGDLNNTQVLRKTTEILPDIAYEGRTLAISEAEDDTMARKRYRLFLLDDEVATKDWISRLELSTVMKLAETDLRAIHQRMKILVLYASRILHRLGCDVRVFDPTGLPVKDDVQHTHAKVQELRELSKWSDGHVWVCPEQHGTLTAVFKNQIDWIPLSTGSVRPTQGRTLAIAQVSGGSQSFNTVNAMRVLGRWMRMFTIPNQSSIPKAYTQFTDAVDEKNVDRQSYLSAEGGSRMLPSGNRDRLVDCMEEFVKYTTIMRQHFDLFNDRYSERAEREEKRRMKEAEAGTINGVHLASV
nr:nadph-dependent fmn reductase arsh [Quercus suber]